MKLIMPNSSYCPPWIVIYFMIARQGRVILSNPLLYPSTSALTMTMRICSGKDADRFINSKNCLYEIRQKVRKKVPK